MKKYFNFILFLIILGFNFTLNAPDIFSACNKNSNGLSGGDSSGIVCTDYGAGCSATCNTSADWVDRSCNSNETYEGYSQYRCYKNDANCINYTYCNKCVEKTCETCPSGTTPSNFCYSPDVCDNNFEINQGLSDCSDYYCCDCNTPVQNQCTCDPVKAAANCPTYSWTQTGASCTPRTCYGTKNCGPTPTPESNSGWNDNCYCGTNNSFLGTAQCDYYFNSDTYNSHQWCYSYDSGYYKPSNCTCDEMVWRCESLRWCSSDYPYFCNGGCYNFQACDSCNGSCTCGTDSNGWCIRPSNGTDGTCNSYTTSRRQASAPNNSSLCYSGYPTTPTLSGYNWIWTCSGTAGICGAASGSDIGCSAVANTPPTFNGLVIKNKTNTTVSAESGNKNQICDTNFNSSRSVTFQVGASDPDGIADISSITLTWNGNTITRKSAISAITTFGTTLPSSYNTSSIYPLVVTITDSAGATAVDTSRYFKVWDCKVPISGTIYDGTEGASCPNTGFSVTNPDALNLKNLVFKQNNIGFTMSINSDKTSYYSDSNNSLIWGSNIAVPQFNSDISLSDPILIKTLSSSGTSTCSNDYFVNTNTVDPYATAIGITADFTGTLIQDPWWQANGGGVISNTSVNGQVPSTCTETNNCVNQISIGSLVAAPSISNNGNSSYQNWYYGNTSGLPNTNAKLADYNTNYDYFYTQYFVKQGVGTTFSGNKSISDIGTTGIYFIKGNLTIDTDKTLINSSDFLMLIVKGNINVGIGASRVDGILVANNISASGSNPAPLTFNGSLYASNNVNFSRDFDTRLDNNTKPAIVVNYDPELIFNMPGDIAKVLTNWQWGN